MLQALEACLAHAQAQGADQLAFLGDLVGYGADPRAVVRRIMDLASKGALVLKGNHDQMAVQPPDRADKPWATARRSGRMTSWTMSSSPFLAACP